VPGRIRTRNRKPCVNSLHLFNGSPAAGLSGHVALEGASRGIRSNIVVPGNIDTPLRRMQQWERAKDDQAPIVAAPMLSPVGRQGTGWDLAHATTYLLSDEAAYVTAQVVAIDGGLTSLGLR
jgi:NAD(P)-dependent dehydrogenase (short-subunit alcohol dehydrogenase family)